jgi:hypothetical protein
MLLDSLLIPCAQSAERPDNQFGSVGATCIGIFVDHLTYPVVVVGSLRFYRGDNSGQRNKVPRTTIAQFSILLGPTVDIQPMCRLTWKRCKHAVLSNIRSI